MARSGGDFESTTLVVELEVYALVGDLATALQMLFKAAEGSGQHGQHLPGDDLFGKMLYPLPFHDPQHGGVPAFGFKAHA